MTWWQGLILGVVQGLTEFLPISSSAHLTLLPWALHWEDPGLAFDVALHLGTLIAVVWFFWQEWIVLAAAFFTILRHRRVEDESERRLVWVVVATIPGGIAGLLFNHYADTVLRTPMIIACALIVMGIVLWLVDRRAGQARNLDSMGWKSAVGIGLAQMLAIIPGVSRSGSTITAGRALTYHRESAAVFSFLLSVPIIAAALVLEGPKALHHHGEWLPLAAGLLGSIVAGWLAIRVLLKYVARHSYGVFAIYRVGLGALVLAKVFLG